MPIRRRTLGIAFGALAALGLLGRVSYNYVDTALRADATIHGDFHFTPEDAMEEGTFIRYVPVATDTLRSAGGRLSFGRAWIHEESHIGFGWMAKPKLVREGTYRLCFNLVEGEPDPGMIMPVPKGASQWIVDVGTGLRYDGSGSYGDPWRYCRDVARPFPASVSMTLVTDDSLRARMRQFVGAVHPPAPAATHHEAQAVVQDDGRTMLLTHTEWNGFPMLWISERMDGDGASARWRVRRVMDYPGELILYGVRYATCTVPGQAPAGTLVLQGLHSPRDDINSAWRVDAATADLAPVSVAGLTCGETRQF
ncbi:MAG TPA: hypothetical protein VLK84_01290 [Longimicrobium sp.]|nr:hypothetical protein [Longimicrobium sp.]